MKTVELRVYGKVQGVFFRKGTYEKAKELGLGGKVMNLPGDAVYIIATGDPEKIDQLISWCRQGPPRAQVDRVEITEKQLTEFTEFSIER